MDYHPPSFPLLVPAAVRWDWGPADDGACVYSTQGEHTETIAFLYCAHPESAASMAEERARMLTYARLMASAPALLAALRTLVEAGAQGQKALPAGHDAWAAAQAAVEQAGIVGNGW